SLPDGLQEIRRPGDHEVSGWSVATLLLIIRGTSCCPDLLTSCKTGAASSEGEHKWLFERFGDPAQESVRVGAVDDAMVVRQRQRQHQPRLELRAVPRGLVAAARDAEDRDFGPVDDRAEPHAADAAEVRDRDDAARHLVERELAGARLLRDLG